MASFNGWRLTRAGFVFIIVTLLLAVLVFAGVRFAQQRGEQVRQDEATQIARDNQSDEQTPAIGQETPVPQDTQPQSSGVAAPSGPTAAAPEALPETGIASILPILLLAAVTYIVAGRMQQRRAVAANTFEG